MSRWSKLPTACWPLPSVKWVSNRKRKAVFVVAPVLMPVRRTCCRSSFTGSVKASSMTKPLHTTCQTALNAAPVRGSVRVTSRWCSISVRKKPRFTLSRRKKSATPKLKRALRHARPVWSGKKPHALSATKKRPFNPPQKISRPLTRPSPACVKNRPPARNPSWLRPEACRITVR